MCEWEMCLSQYIFNKVSNSDMINSLWPGEVTCYCINIGSGNDMLPEGTKPLPEPMLTSH